MSYPRGKKAERFAQAVLAATHIVNRISNATPPTQKEVAAHFGVTRPTLHDWLELYKDRMGSIEPSMCATIQNWQDSLSLTPEKQRQYALLMRDMLESPIHWGIRSHEDIATALSIPTHDVRRYYLAHWQPDWPELPTRKRGWVSQEAARAIRLGDAKKLDQISARHDELVAMRQELIQQRLAEFDQPQQ